MEEGAQGSSIHLPQEARKVTCPFDVGVWRKALADHPCQWFRDYLTRGITQGFRLGFHGNDGALTSSFKNMGSADDHPEVVESYLAAEVAKGRVAVFGTANQARLAGIHCSPFGVIPKKNRVNKWRLILNLSFPEGGV